MKHLITLIALMLSAPLAYAGDVMHKVAVHVDENDPKLINMALNNVQNLKNYYTNKGEEVAIEVVAYGPGLLMYIDGKSPVADRIATMSLEIDNLQFSACGNTHRKMSQKAGKDVPLLSEAQIVPSGVVRLIELQENGYAYIRP